MLILIDAASNVISGYRIDGDGLLNQTIEKFASGSWVEELLSPCDPPVTKIHQERSVRRFARVAPHV